jgi:hypothetical protein
MIRAFVLFAILFSKSTFANFEKSYSLKFQGTIATTHSDDMTHYAPVKVVIIKDPLIKSSWSYDLIEQRIKKTANILKQCGIELSKVDVYELELLNREIFEAGTDELKQAVTVNTLEKIYPFRSLNSLTLSKAVEVLKESQVIFYASDVCGGECNAFSGTYAQIPYSERVARNKIWIAESAVSTINPISTYSTEAHELGHNLLNDPTHFDNEFDFSVPVYNIMSTSEGRNGAFTQGQCSKILKSPSVKKK